METRAIGYFRATKIVVAAISNCNVSKPIYCSHPQPLLQLDLGVEKFFIICLPTYPNAPTNNKPIKIASIVVLSEVEKKCTFAMILINGY